jgi:predicted secreted hydrolase
VGSFELRALLDDQELDSRASTGTVYWEGLAELLGADGARLGLGYLEMTGRAQPLKLGL